MMTNITFSLSLKDTSILKGFALLLLLAHHLFYIQNGLYNDIHIVGNHYLVQDIGTWCKVCVAIFVFLSGYGLTVGAKKTGGVQNVKHFYWHRLTKLLMNYWFIWLLFVPISVFGFGYTFTDAYCTHVILKFILDFLGVINCFGWLGYNGTWWFYSCIIVLYFAYPWLYKLMDKCLWGLLAVVVALYFIPGPYFHSINIYYASFVVGMLVCRYEQTICIHNPVFWIALFAILAVERFISKDVYIFDSILALCLVVTYKCIPVPTIIGKLLDFIGKHSMNIFLFHTFIYYYWFQSFIYASHNPIVIFLLLLLICLFISIGIEFLKKITRFELIVKYIDSLYGF